MNEKRPAIGFTCAYTPLAVLEAAGFSGHRVLPTGGQWPDQAGRILHDNLCPHVKKVLDRALCNDLPELAGMVFMNSCDAMRRLYDAWIQVRPGEPALILDLPPMVTDRAIAFFAREVERMARSLGEWNNVEVTDDALAQSIGKYNQVADLFARVRVRAAEGTLSGGAPRLQELYNDASSQPFSETIARLEKVLTEAHGADPAAGGVQVFLFGNVLPDPGAVDLFTQCGARVVGDDFCTGSRLFAPLEVRDGEKPALALARSILNNPPCARTFDPEKPLALAQDLLERARACGAQGVIGHVLKFCDPYLARLPVVRETFKQAGMPLLLLEGDCSLGSIGQQRTRIEAFVEMLR
ncbi:MAG: 2-hydroxyacyl-CoA dehydratase family protein [Proteobacteria bacterium]|nr:2-hydroxyacyl-CoA dehydratase family protein [Pseudomonadota bacterium]